MSRVVNRRRAAWRVDGEDRCRAVDRDFSTFGRVYLRGNDHQLFDNLVLTPR